MMPPRGRLGLLAGLLRSTRVVRWFAGVVVDVEEAEELGGWVVPDGEFCGGASFSWCVLEESSAGSRFGVA